MIKKELKGRRSERFSSSVDKVVGKVYRDYVIFENSSINIIDRHYLSTKDLFSSGGIVLFV